MINKIKTWLGILPTFGGVPRSSHWTSVRREHLKLSPTCAVCGGTRDIEVHHIKPYNLFPELELVPSNLITLCNHFYHHLYFGHLGSYSSFNQSIRSDALDWFNRIKNRPKI